MSPNHELLVSNFNLFIKIPSSAFRVNANSSLTSLNALCKLVSPAITAPPTVSHFPAPDLC